MIHAQQISQLMFCGDEVPAAVIDLGSCTSRFGTGGQDAPRHVFRSDVGIVAAEGGLRGNNVNSSSSSSSSSGSSSSNNSSSSSKKILCGDMALRCVSDKIEVDSLYTPIGTSSDGGWEIHWDRVEALMEYGLLQCMRVDPKDQCMLVAENKCNDTASKKQMMELCFETFSAPAAYMAPNSVLSSFSAGRPTSMVIDLGASEVRVSPLVDGYVLRKAEVVTRRGGDWLDEIVGRELEQYYSQHMKPWFETDGKIYPGPLRQSFRKLHLRDVARDVKKWMSFVPYVPVPRENRHTFIHQTIQLPTYELPDGTAVSKADGLCTAMERLFLHDYASVSPDGTWTEASATPAPRLDFRKTTNPKMYLYLPSHAQPMELDTERATLPELTMASLMKSDVDARRELLANVLLVGGGSNIDGVAQRLTHELTPALPTVAKLKINPLLPMERHHAAWIGGSILSICGTFQQMWVSKHEYNEYGPQLLTHRLGN